MPGKVNPSLLECLNMLCFQIVGMDTANPLAVGGGQLELNVMMPLLAHNLTRGPQLLVNFLPVVRTRCVDGITANPEKCRHYLEESPSVITALTPKIGYARAAEIFKEAVARGVRVREVLLERKSSPKRSSRRRWLPRRPSRPARLIGSDSFGRLARPLGKGGETP